jgi:hypothetical protein
MTPALYESIYLTCRQPEDGGWVGIAVPRADSGEEKKRDPIRPCPHRWNRENASVGDEKKKHSEEIKWDLGYMTRNLHIFRSFRVNANNSTQLSSAQQYGCSSLLFLRIILPAIVIAIATAAATTTASPSLPPSLAAQL